MKEHSDKNLVGQPSDYGSRTLDEERRRTADGEPRVERGTAESAISRPPKNAHADAPSGDPQKHADT